MKPLTAKDRELRIELLRTRAALERQGIRRAAAQLERALSPGQVLGTLMHGVSGRSAARWGMSLLAISRRYPLLLSSASTGLSLLGRRGRWVGLLAGLALGWQALRKPRAARTEEL
jgi:hypothetical protein